MAVLLESRHRVLCGVGLKLKHPCVLVSFLILVSRRLYFSFFLQTQTFYILSEPGDVPTYFQLLLNKHSAFF